MNEELNMNILGIRVTPKKIYFSIFDKHNNEFKNIEVIVVPQSLAMPEKLKYIRNNIFDLLREYHIQQAGIKITEANAQKMNIGRLYIEGVIQETFASSEIESYKTLMLAGMASKLQTSAKELKKFIEKQDNQTEIQMNVTDYVKEEIESMLVAMAVAQ
jgi:hypothetical protein|nr:MAG TPA: Protein of unknown function (DUF3010) [Caudoviricetes sp.]